MNDPFSSLPPQTSQESRSSTPSLESGDGLLPFDSQDGPRIDPFGPGVAPASLSLRPAKAKESQMSDTSGLKCSGSSKSAALQQFLGSRLEARLESVGSMEYRQTWKVKVTPAGRLLSAHTASARPISDSVSIGSLPLEPWPKTPQASDGQGGVMEIRPGTTGKYKLRDFAQLAGWPTAQAHDVTTRGNTMADGHSFPHDLSNAALGVITELFLVPTGRRVVLAPEFSLWLMGFPEAWVSAAPGAKDWQEAQAALELEYSKDQETP